MKKLVVLLVLLIVLAGWIAVRIQFVCGRLALIEDKLELKAQKEEKNTVNKEGTASEYRITVDMWHVFEKELQDYKQRLIEGKRSFEEQKTAWDKIMNDLKKNLQDYDKFISAEGEFWEKQLRGYEKALSTNEERMERLGYIVDELQNIMVDFRSWRQERDANLTGEGQREIAPAPAQEVKKPVNTVIKPSIKGRGSYNTYPPLEEKDSSGKGEEEPAVIRGKVSGSGDYTTY